MDIATATGAVVVCQVLTGLGGVGKTQLAAGLAHRIWLRRELDLLVWITATSRSSIVTTYAQAAAEIHGVEDENPDQGATRFLAWLAATERRWLVVLDDVADPNDLRGLWPPTGNFGRTVVTTRRRDAALASGRRVVDVGLFTAAESAAYLKAKLGGDPVRLDEAAELADNLGHLPLALAQAAAYILDRKTMTCAGYRRRFANQARKLADLAPDALPDEHTGPVAVTWSLSIALADELPPTGLARPVLELAALLDPNGIPTDVFTTAAVLDYLGIRTGASRQVDGEDTTDTLDSLDRINLITHNSANRTVRVHALVQRVVREATPPAYAAALATAAADALVEVWPAIERDRELGQILRGNATALHTHAKPLLWDLDTGYHPVLFTAGHSLGQTGQITAAIDYHDTLRVTASQRLGPDHRQTLTIRHSLAWWRGVAGDPAGATTAYAELLGDRLRVLGPEHPDTLATRHDLAWWRGVAGDPAGAAAAFAELVIDQVRVLDADHPDTLATRNNLAYWRGAAGDPGGAGAACADLLIDQVRVLGPDHPDTLATRNNLAWWQGKAGDPAGAATAYAELLRDRLRVLGPDHPDTLATRSDLAWWQGEGGDPAGAVTAYAELLRDRLRVLGPNHPDTLATRNNLAWWQGEGGDPAGATTAYAELLRDRLRVLGPNHPNTLATRNNLAYWREKADDVIRTENPTAARDLEGANSGGTPE
ncbi:tetratricopeptide repeat protein [Micromonospora sp. NPDC050397]|uniref:tetratricopeptide repeat protein n=1 Tax=Micromonospora sp. NPDC050397 TaxID=3364279 RepID=UPI00384BAEC7